MEELHGCSVRLLVRAKSLTDMTDGLLTAGEDSLSSSSSLIRPESPVVKLSSFLQVLEFLTFLLVVHKSYKQLSVNTQRVSEVPATYYFVANEKKLLY